MSSQLNPSDFESSIEICNKSIDNLINSLQKSERSNGMKIEEGSKIKSGELAWGKYTYEEKNDKPKQIGIYGTSVAVRTFRLVDPIKFRDEIKKGQRWLNRQLTPQADKDIIQKQKLAWTPKLCLLLDALKPCLNDKFVSNLLKSSQDEKWYPVFKSKSPRWSIPSALTLYVLSYRYSLDNQAIKKGVETLRNHLDKVDSVAERALILHALEKFGLKLRNEIECFLNEFEKSSNFKADLKYDTLQGEKSLEISESFTLDNYLHYKGIAAFEQESFIKKLNQLISNIDSKGYKCDRAYETKEIFVLASLLNRVKNMLMQAKYLNYNFEDVYFKRLSKAQLKSALTVFQVDLEKHSPWLRGLTKEKTPPAMDARKKFADSIKQILQTSKFHRLFWAGDGGVFVYEDENPLEDVILTADKVFDFFECWKKEHKKLETNKLHVRLSSHFLDNVWAYPDPGLWASKGLNDFIKNERKIATKDRLAITSDLLASQSEGSNLLRGINLKKRRMTMEDKTVTSYLLTRNELKQLCRNLKNSMKQTH